MTCDDERGCVGNRACATRSDCEDDDACTTDERCDSATRTCMSSTLDGDGDGEPPAICGGDDCDDGEWNVSSRGVEICDGLDNDCDGTADDGTGAALCGDARASCESGWCTCAIGLERCGFSGSDAECADRQNDPLNCGECGHDCGGMTCTAGHCDCPSDQTDCGFFEARCVDTDTSVEDCGACGEYCPGTCSGGACTVCGGRGQACCATGPACVTGSACRAGTCAACGGSGQPCCTGGTLCTGNTLACGAAGTCTHCGGAGEPCCPSGSPCTAEHTSCDATSVCAPDACAAPITRYPDVDLPRCSAATMTCMLASTTSACVLSCLDADTTPAGIYGFDCYQCYSYATDYCSDSRGCHAQWADYNCCYEANCAGSTDATCGTRLCASELSALRTCSNALPDDCFYFDTGEPSRCFP